MKKSKIILGCIFSLLAFALTLLVGLPSKVYASEVSDYIDDNYSNLVYSDNLLNSSLFDNRTEWTSSGNTSSNFYLMFFYSDSYLWSDIACKFQLSPDSSYGSHNYTFTVDGRNNGKLYGVVGINGDVQDNKNNFEINLSAGTYTYSVFLENASLDNYKVKNFMINVGNFALPYEPYITGSMIYEQAFNKGVEEATNNNGIWKYIHNVFVGTEEDNNYNLSELKSKGFLSGYEMSLYSMSLVANESYSTIYIDFEFTSAPLTELDFFFKGYNSYTMNIYDEDGVVVNVDTSSLTSLNYEDILQKNPNFGNYIDTISIVASSPDALNSILNNSSYSEGFQNGYSGGFISGKNEGYSQGFNAGLLDEANNKANYEEGFQNGSLSGYNQGYNDGASSDIQQNGIKTLFNSILSYPVNLISNVLDFEFMGVNIASLIMFIVSIGIVVFVVKKFW